MVFHAKAGSNFYAFIHNCNHTGNSFKKQEEEEPIVIRQEGEQNKQEEKTPITNVLYDNYPNPFTAHTHIDYTVTEPTHVTLTITNLCGYEVIKLVDKQEHPAGNYTGIFESGKLSSGIYFYTLQIGDKIYTKKMVKIAK